MKLGLLLCLAGCSASPLFEQQLEAFLGGGGDLQGALRNVMRQGADVGREMLLLQEEEGVTREGTMALADELEKDVDREPAQEQQEQVAHEAAMQQPATAPVVIQSQAGLKAEMRKRLYTCRMAGKMALKQQAAKCSRLETRHALTKRASRVAMAQCMAASKRAQTQAALVARAGTVGLDMCQNKLKQAMKCVENQAQQESYMTDPSSNRYANDYTMQQPAGNYRL